VRLAVGRRALKPATILSNDTNNERLIFHKVV